MTCSGAYKTGSLRVVRRGVGLRELAALELEGVQRLWAIETGARCVTFFLLLMQVRLMRPLRGDSEQLLVIGFFNETRTFRLSRTTSEDGASDDDLDLDIDEIDVPNFRTDAPTLFAGALQGGTLMQVTAQGVTISGGMTWTHEGGKKVTAAAALGEGRGDAIVLALAGGEVVVLEQQDGILAQTRYVPLGSLVAASPDRVCAGPRLSTTMSPLSLSAHPRLDGRSPPWRSGLHSRSILSRFRRSRSAHRRPSTRPSSFAPFSSPLSPMARLLSSPASATVRS